MVGSMRWIDGRTGTRVKRESFVMPALVRAMRCFYEKQMKKNSARCPPSCFSFERHFILHHFYRTSECAGIMNGK